MNLLQRLLELHSDGDYRNEQSNSFNLPCNSDSYSSALAEWGMDNDDLNELLRSGQLINCGFYGELGFNQSLGFELSESALNRSFSRPSLLF